MFFIKLKMGDSSLIGALIWTIWHGSMLILCLGLAVFLMEVNMTPSRLWVPVGFVGMVYLSISLALVMVAWRPILLMLIWLGLTSAAIAIGYLGLRIMSSPFVFPSLAFAVFVAALISLAPYASWRYRLAGSLSIAAAGAAWVALLSDVVTAPTKYRNAFSTSLYALQVRKSTDLAVVPSADGGALAVLDEGVLLAGGDGTFQWLYGSENLNEMSAVRLSIPAPADREEYLSDFRDPSSAPRLRLTDIEFSADSSPDRLYAAHQAWDPTGRCYTLNLSSIALTWNEGSVPAPVGDWDTVFQSFPCLTAEGLFDDIETGGRIARDVDGTLLLTLGDVGFSGLDGSEPFSQIENGNAYGKIWRIDPETGNASIVSIGHRNPQGLVLAQDGKIWSSEHGPQGGDEINIIRQGANYGWPIVTYGTNYGSNTWPLDVDGRDHREYDEPALSFVPSVATSALIEVTGDMFPRWKGDLLLATLRTQSLIRLRTVEDRIIYSEVIQIDERVRDLAELPDGSILIWVDRGLLLQLSISGRPSAYRRYCAACHSPTVGTPAGPTLVGLIGRETASVPGFPYSSALSSIQGQWDESRLRAFLRDVDSIAPGTPMILPPLDEDTIDELIGYFRDQ